MSTTPTERRLAITPGQLIHDEDGAIVELSEAHEKNDYNFVVADFFDPTGGGCANNNARLFLNAHNTYNSCHLTPSELLAKLREAAAMIVRIGYSCDDLGHRKDQYHNWDQPCPVVAEIDAFLSNLPK